MLAEEEVSRRTIVLIVNANKLTARALARTCQAALRKLQQERKAHQAPQGKQTVAQLMNHGDATSGIPVETPALFDRVARRCKVDYAFYKTNDGKHLLLFRAQQKDAVTACFEDYSRLVLKRGRSRRTPILERLKQAQERVRQQPQRAREREAAYEDR